MKLRALFVLIGICTLVAAPGLAHRGWAAPVEPISGTSQPGQLAVDSYFGTSDLVSVARFVKYCTFPTLDCNTHPNGTPCGDPEIFVFCHCTSNQGQHFCVQNP